MTLSNVLKRVRRLVNAMGWDVMRYNSARNLRFYPYFITKSVEGVEFKFFVGDADGRDWYHLGQLSNLWPEMRFLRDAVLEKGDTVVECGTHHACAALLISEWVGGEGAVISYEANPVNFEIAKINVASNAKANIELRQRAVGSSAGAIEIDSSSSNSHVTTNFQGGLSSAREVVQCVRLDDEGVVANVLKIDVEGFEKEVLVGARELLKNAPKLAVEIHTDLLPQYNTTVDEIFELIGPNRYDFWVQWDDLEDPRPYSFEEKITTRVHLFAIPKLSGSNSAPSTTIVPTAQAV